ncbi:CAP domain-containing protein [Dietzia sp. ANT_WB102]|uniref:CAP domain-containing protein n=1 Tax=Dietzia sp. ANT_WB102 TaxID=2597345 RepID=UPI0011EEC287|nr:CAP domain-containing protein [Dietzia sp. ANT_WB102]KAA0918005.1 CAP domain-containing protein [Dietzia sp. ANT_WB102]
MRHSIRSAVATGAAALLLASGAGTAAAQGSLELALPLFSAIPGLASIAPETAPGTETDPAAAAAAELVPEEVRLMAFEGSVVAAVNEARLAVGAERLVADPALEASARERAVQLAEGDPTTGDLPVPADAGDGDATGAPGTVETRSADRTVLALPAGATPQKALTALLSDTGMRERMLDGQFVRVGVGVATAEDGTVHVVQDFARH